MKIAVITVADKPGPVLLNLYVDNVYVGQANFDNNDDSRHLRIYTNGSGSDGDRNMLLDSMATVTCTNC